MADNKPVGAAAAGGDQPSTSAAAGAASGAGKPQDGKMHTIALIQSSRHDSTRFYQDSKNVEEALEGILKMYETRLKELHPGAKSITYDYNSLCLFIDDLKEVCLLSWSDEIQGYKRYDRGWVKAALQDLLSNAVAQAGSQGGAKKS